MSLAHLPLSFSLAPQTLTASPPFVLQSEGSFKHIAHMGYTSEKGFSSSGVDPSWQALLDQLGSQGISQKQIQENEGFIREFVQGQGGLPVRFLVLLLFLERSADQRYLALIAASSTKETRASSCSYVEAQSPSPTATLSNGCASHCIPCRGLSCPAHPPSSQGRPATSSASLKERTPPHSQSTLSASGPSKVGYAFGSLLEFSRR